MTDGQNLFAAALLDPALAVPDGLVDGTTNRAGGRFDVYRNNVAVSLAEALRTGFPVVTKLIGRQNMDGLAGIFLRAHPPSDPLMMHYGAGFPDFLARTAQLAHLGYLPDIARLELAIRRSYHAADAVAIDPALLGGLPTEDLMRSTLSFAPATEVLCSDWPIHDIWLFNTDDNAAKPQVRAQDVLITRPEFDPSPQLLPHGGAVWIKHLMSGQTIGDAFDAAFDDCPQFDLTAALTLLLCQGALISLTPKDRP